MDRFQLDFADDQVIELMPKTSPINAGLASPFDLTCSNFYTAMHQDSNFDYVLEVYQRGVMTLRYQRTYSGAATQSYAQFALQRQTPFMYDDDDQIFTYNILPQSALAARSKIFIEVDWQAGDVAEWEVSSNLGNPFLDVSNATSSGQMEFELLRPYFPELDGPFQVSFKVKGLRIDTFSDLTATFRQEFPGSRISEEGSNVLYSMGTSFESQGSFFLDRVVNFGRRCCYSGNFVGPIKYILDVGENYPAGSSIFIDYRFFTKYSEYASRYVELKCFFGSEFEDLYIDTRCSVDSRNRLTLFLPTGLNLTPGHRIPFTVQYMGEMNGMAGVLAMPLDRYAIVYPRSKAGFAGVFTAQTQSCLFSKMEVNFPSWHQDSVTSLEVKVLSYNYGMSLRAYEDDTKFRIQIYISTF